MLPRISLVVVAAFALACPGPAEEECNATKACASGFTCQAAKCVAETTPGGGGGGGLACPETGVSGPVNLLDNPGFECGDPPTQWNQGFFGTLTKTTARTGTGAGRWTSTASATDTSVHYWLTSDIQSNVLPGQTVCARAYVKGTGTNAVVKIQLVGSNLVRQSFAQPLTASWAKIENNTVTGVNDRQAIFGVGLRYAQSGDYIEVDDAAMWISNQPDGGCSNR